MRVEDVAPALRERLGPEVTDGLLATLDETGREWTTAVVTQMVDRFERRLTEGMSGLRVELAAQRAEFRDGLASQRADLLEAIATQGAGLRSAVAEQGAALRSEIAAVAATSSGGCSSSGQAS